MAIHPPHTTEGTLFASRVVGPATYIVFLERVQLIAAGVLVATLSDFAIPGSMREAMRYAVVDAPWQLWMMGIALFLACAAVRFTGEAITELVAPDLFYTGGNVGRLAHLLPRLLSIVLGVATALPLLVLAAGGPQALSSGAHAAQNQIAAAVAGAIFVAIGVAVALVGRVHTVSTGASLPPPAPLFRVAFGLMPIAFSVVVCGAILGLWSGNEGMAFDTIARYRAGGAAQIILEAVCLYFCCISARLTLAIVLELFGIDWDKAPLQRGLISILPRLAAFGIGAALTSEFLLQVFGPQGAYVPSTLPWVIGVAALFCAVGIIAAFSDLEWLPHHNGMNVFTRTGLRWREVADRFATLTPGWKFVLGALLALAVAVCVFFIADENASAAQILGPITVILLWGFSSTLIFFPVAYASHISRMPLMLLLTVTGVTFAGFDLNDNHGVRGVDSVPSGPQVQSAYRETIQLGNWLESRGDWNKYDRYPIFLVATEGGGIRAAYFTATVLAGLQDRCPLFAQHTLAISGVSGGSVGAAVFAALTADRAHNASDAPCDLAGHTQEPMTARARRVLSADLLSPLVGRMLFPDALQRVLPVAIDRFDRARGIEGALEKSWAETNADCATCATRMSESVSALYSWQTGSIRPPIPHLFLNTTEVKTGKIVPFATGQVPALATPFLDQAEIDQPGVAALRQVSLQDLMAGSETSAPLSTAALLSARFPYLTPAGLLTLSGHYVDGGYFENSGTSIIGGLLQNLVGQKLTYRNPANPALEAAVRNVVFVTIIIHSEPCDSNCDVVGAADTAEDTSWNEVMSPVRALLNTRDQRAQYSITDLDAVTALIEQLAPRRHDSSAVDDGTSCDELVCSVTLRFGSAPGAEVPLTWLLSRPAREAMDQAVESMRFSDVRHGIPASAVVPITSDQPDTNVVLGSYSRILCLLAAQKGAMACQ